MVQTLHHFCHFLQINTLIDNILIWSFEKSLSVVYGMKQKKSVLLKCILISCKNWLFCGSLLFFTELYKRVTIQMIMSEYLMQLVLEVKVSLSS